MFYKEESFNLHNTTKKFDSIDNINDQIKRNYKEFENTQLNTFNPWVLRLLLLCYFTSSSFKTHLPRKLVKPIISGYCFNKEQDSFCVYKKIKWEVCKKQVPCSTSITQLHLSISISIVSRFLFLIHVGVQYSNQHNIPLYMSNATQAFLFKHHLCGFRKLQREVKGTTISTTVL